MLVSINYDYRPIIFDIPSILVPIHCSIEKSELIETVWPESYKICDQKLAKDISDLCISNVYHCHHFILIS